MPGSRSTPLAIGPSLRWDALSRKLPTDLGDVLEVGCGRGAFTGRLVRRAKSVVAIEPDHQSFVIAQQQLGSSVQLRNIECSELLSSECFDTVCAFEVLEHIEHDRAALEDWIEHLRPGGHLVLSVPADSKRLGDWDEMVGHYRRYDRKEMKNLLEGVGLRVVDISQYNFPAGYFLETARNLIARRTLRKGAADKNFAERTAGSGRLFQPESSFTAAVMRLVSLPAIALQRAFPDRGLGLIAIAQLD